VVEALVKALKTEKRSPGPYGRGRRMI